MKGSMLRLATIAGLLLPAGVIAAAVPGRAQTAATSATPTTPDPSATRATTIGLMRSINTAEYVYRHNYGHFGTMDDLFDGAHYLRRDPSRYADVTKILAGGSRDGLPNIWIALVLAPREDSYAVAVYDKVKDDNGFAAFSDPAGVIYIGHPLGTPGVDMDPAVDHGALINLMRSVNTAEVSYHAKYDRFEMWSTLHQEGLLDGYAKLHNVSFSSDPEVLPNVDVTVLVPPTYDTWSVAIHDKAEGHHDYAVFSDATGIIYQAKPLQ